ncbi:MAG: hypothetical protein HY763_01265 [Planctomycetes bacterium]|nr:hypothetical protein [Planctomycetota bacterium]
MTSAPPLNVKVIYSAATARRRSPRTVMPSPRRGRRSTRLPLLGLLNLLAAGAFCYATWWPADRYLYLKLTFKTPAIDVNAVAQMFNIPMDANGGGGGENRLDADPFALDEFGGSESHGAAAATGSAAGTVPRFTGKTAATLIGASAYGWLTLSSISVCALALAAGAAWGRSGWVPRRIAVVLAAGGALALAWGVYDVLSRYGHRFPTNYARFGTAGLGVWFVLLGLAIARAPRGLSRAAGVLLIAAAAGSATGLYLGAQCGAVAAEQSNALFLALVFMVHSLYGWLLWPLARRWAVDAGR